MFRRSWRQFNLMNFVWRCFPVGDKKDSFGNAFQWATRDEAEVFAKCSTLMTRCEVPSWAPHYVVCTLYYIVNLILWRFYFIFAGLSIQNLINTIHLVRLSSGWLLQLRSTLIDNHNLACQSSYSLIALGVPIILSLILDMSTEYVTTVLSTSYN